MKILRVLTLVSALFLIDGLMAQIADKFNVQVFVAPSNYYRVKINDELQEVGNKFWLEPGVYKFSFWAPDHIERDTLVEVPAGQIIKIPVKLDQLPEYTNYKRQVNKYQMYHTKSNVGKVGMFVGVLGLTINQFNLNNKNLEYVKYTNGYNYGLAGYSDTGYETSEDQLRKAKNVQYIFGGVTAGFAIYTVYNIIKYRSVEIPSYTTDKSFELTNIGLMYTPESGLNFGLTLNF